MHTWLTSLPRIDKRRRNKKSAALARQSRRRRGLEWLEQRVLLASDLSLSESVSPSTAVPGQMVNYQIQLTNNGATAISGATLTNTLANDVQFISASGPNGTVGESGGIVTFSNLSLPAGGTDFFQVKVTPTTSSASPVSDSTSASATGETTVNSSAPLTINAVNPAQAVQDLVVTKTATATTGVLEGQEINFTISVHNTDTTNTAHNVVISDILPAGEDYLNTEQGSDGVYKLSGKQLTDIVGDVAPGATVSATYDVLITKAGTLTDTATATTSSGITNASAGDNVKSLSITAAAALNGANLAVTKVASPTTVAPGQDVTYTATVVNNGTVDAHNVELTDLLPLGMNYVSSTPAAGSGSIIIENGSVVDEIGTLAANGGTATLTIVAAPDASLAGQTVTNQACATTTTGDTDPSDNCGFADVTVTPPGAGAANVSIGKSGPATGTVGQQLTYTITVTNHDTANAASNVTVTDILPLGETVNSNGGLTQNGNVLSETIPSLPADAIDTFTVVVTPSQAGTLTDTASLSIPAGNSNTTTTASVTTVVTAAAVSPNVSIAKTGPATGTVGDQLTYTITVTNNDSSHAASNVAITDTLPSGESLDSATSSSGATISQSGNTLSETLGSLAASGTETITVIVTPNQVGTFTDTANVSVTGNTGSPTSASVSTVVSAAAPNVSIAKTGPADATVGTAFDYTITVTNSGTAAASNVTVSDTLPSQVAFDSATDSQGGTVTESGGVVTDVISSLPVGVDTITIHVNPTTAGSATNTANVTVSGNTGSPTSASVTTTVSAAAPNVSIAKTGPANATVGAAFDYTVTVTNSGTAAASNVTVSDTLPSQVAFVSATDNQGGTVTESGGVVTDVISSLPVGVDTITIHVNPTTAGSATNTASVTVSGNTGSPTSASVTTVVSAAAGPNVSINKTGPANATVGTAYDYTITVTNNGSSAASNVAISDTLPSQITLVTATDNQGGSISESGQQFSDTVASLAAGATDTIVLHVLPTAAGTVTNTASVNVAGNTSNQTQSSVTTTVSAATGTSVSIVKTGPATATVGIGYDYTIKVINNGSAAASNVTVSDTLPGGLNVGPGTDNSGGTITESGSAFTDVIGSLPAGATDTITLHVTPTAAGTVVNTASVQVTGNTSNQTTSSVTTVVSPVTAATNVSVAKTGPATATVGAQFTYTITVTNNGSAAASNVVVNDTLPSSVTFVSANDNKGGAIVESGSQFTDTIGSLAAGATDTITLNVTPTAAGSITNTATVTVTGNTSGQTSSSVTTTVSSVSGAANVSVNKSGPSTGTVGQALTYTIVITNNGSSSASNVAFTDNLPAGLTSISATDSLGGTVTVSGNSLTETIGALGAGASDTITVTATPTQAGTIVNTAVITVAGGNNGQGSSSVTTTVGSTQITGHTCFENGQPGDGTDLTFVRNLYRELLGRDPDPSGQQAWLNYLETGNPTQSGNGHSTAAQRHVVIDDFLSSPEYLNHLVTCMYENFLGRQADNSGLQFFVGQLMHGVDEEVVLSDIVGSQEYYANAGGTSQGFVNALYRDIMGRQADPSGLAYWSGQASLNNVPRDVFVREFLGTPEAEHRLLNANYPGAPGATGAPGTPAGGTYALADITGGGWENLFFQGSFLHGQDEAHNDFFAKLQAFTPYDDVIEDMLETQHYYDASQGF